MANFNFRQREILKMLLNTEFLTVSEIEIKIKISDKTIRNEIKDINQMVEGLIVSVRGKGYTTENKDKINEILNGESKNENRQLLIFKHLVTAKSSNFYDLADRYYISESTLDNDITDLNKGLLKKYNTNILRVKNQLILNCSEEDRRKIYTHFLIYEVENYNFNLANYNDYFEYSNMEELKEIILEFFKEREIRLNDIEIVSFILHVAILIERIKKNFSLTSFVDIQGEQRLDISEDFCECIAKKYDLVLNEAEKNYVASLLSSRIILQLPGDSLDRQILDFIEQTLLEVDDYYRINLLEDNNIKNNLLIHLLSLKDRAETMRMLNNPLIKEIKENFPLIYDISVFVSMKIQEHFKIVLNEDEIGFIALHFMCSVEKMRNEEIRIAIIDPISRRKEEYYKTRLLSYFSTENFAVKCFSVFDLDEIKEDRYDFALCTTSLSKGLPISVIQCTPLFTSEDIKKIENAIQELKLNRRKKQIVLSQFDRHLFFGGLEEKNKDEVLKKMCQELQYRGYCDENYLELVMEREKIAPTSFGNLFAIPHPVKKKALRSGISIAILKNPIDWSGQKVKLVFLFSLTEENDNLMKLYETIVNMLDNPAKVKRLIKMTTFEEFIEEFMS